MTIVLWIILLAVVFSAAIAGLSAAPWLPTKPSQRRHLLARLKLDPGQTVVDLGCGDGSMLFAIAKLHPEVICVGYDISLFPLALAWIRKLLFFRAYKHVHVHFGDLFKQKIDQADVIFIFLLSKSYPKLIDRLKVQIKPEAKLIVEAWPLPNIAPTETIKAEDLLPVYIYSGEVLRSQP